MELEALRAKYGITAEEHKNREDKTIKSLKDSLAGIDPVLEPIIEEERIKSEVDSIKDLLNFLGSDLDETTTPTILLDGSSNEAQVGE